MPALIVVLQDEKVEGDVRREAAFALGDVIVTRRRSRLFAASRRRAIHTFRVRPKKRWERFSFVNLTVSV